MKEEQSKIDEENREEKEEKERKKRERSEKEAEIKKEKRKMRREEEEKELKQREEHAKGRKILEPIKSRIDTPKSTEYQVEPTGSLEEEEDTASVISSTYSPKNTKSLRSTSVRVGRKIGSVRSRRPSISESEYGDCITKNEIENENENELENLSECSDDSFVSANEEDPGTLNSRPGPLDCNIDDLFTGPRIVDSRNRSDNGMDEKGNENEIENETEKAEEINNLIKHTEANQTQLMSEIRLLGKNNDVTKNILLRLLQRDLIQLEEELHKLKIGYVEQLIVIDNKKMKYKKKMKSKDVLQYGDDMYVYDNELKNEVEERDLTGATASTSLLPY